MYNLLRYEQILSDSQDILQLMAFANDYLRKSKGVNLEQQIKYFRDANIGLSRNMFSGWRLRKPYYRGVNTFRIAALCLFWGLSLEQMLEIGRAEKKRKEGLI